MNVWGHLNAIKELSYHKEFWRKTAASACEKKLFTEERICQDFVRGEEKKILWHRGKIRSLKGKKETPDIIKKSDKKQGVSKWG